MPVVGQMPVTIQYGEQTTELVLIVVVGDGPSLAGYKSYNSIGRPSEPLLQRNHQISTNSLQNMLRFLETN